MHYDAEYREVLTLEDGARVTLRALRRDDVDLLVAGFALLSAETRRQRFHSAKNALTEAELIRLTDCDGIDQYAIIALDAGGAGVGVARWARDADKPAQAELGIVVSDAWQGRGIGGALLRRIVDAAAERGIERLVAVVLPDNARMKTLLRRMGAGQPRDGESQRLEFDLPVASG